MKTRTLLLILAKLLVINYCYSQTVRSATPMDFAVAKTQFAKALAFMPADSVLPGPAPDNPAPEPGSRCTVCMGTGWVRPDSKINIQCQACGGDGIVGAVGTLRPEPRTRGTTFSESKTFSYFWGTDLEDAKALAKSNNVPLVTLFVGPPGTCPPCDVVQAMLDQPQFDKILTRAVCVKLSSDEYADLMNENDIVIVPTLIVGDADFEHGKEIKLTNDKDKLAQAIDEAIISYENRDKRTSNSSSLKSSDAEITPVQYQYYVVRDQPVRNAFRTVTGGSSGGIAVYSGGSSGSIPQYSGGSSGGVAQYYSPPTQYYQPQQYYQQPVQYYSSPQYQTYQPQQYYSAPQQYYGGYSGGYYDDTQYQSYGGYSGGYSRGWGNGGTMVCGPNGCSMQ